MLSGLCGFGVYCGIGLVDAYSASCTGSTTVVLDYTKIAEEPIAINPKCIYCFHFNGTSLSDILDTNKWIKSKL